MAVNVVLLKVLSVLAACQSFNHEQSFNVLEFAFCVYSIFFLTGLFYLFTNVVIFFVSHHMLGSYCLC